MSQPPPPPSQPPSGGYGAPQEPPRDPQGQPAYGYPQQPGQPPQQPPQPPQPPPPGGYGYPQQPGPPGPPPGPPPGGQHSAPTMAYGQPAAPYGQPGPYGRQPPPGYQGPGGPGGPGVPGDPGGGKKNTKLIALIAAAVAVVLLAGAGVFLLTRGDDEGGKKNESKGSSQKSEGDGGLETKPRSTKGDELFNIQDPKVKDHTSVPGAWATDTVFAKVSVKELLIVDLKTDEQKSPVSLKGEVCSASNGMTKRHEVAMVVRETISSNASCNRMVAVDLDTGKIVMDEKMSGAKDESSNDNVTISGDTVATAWIGGSAAYDIPSGKQLWKSKSSNCRDEGYSGGKELYAVTECGSFSKPQIRVQRLDPKNKGKATWKFDVPEGAKNVRIASTDPLVLVVGAGSELTSDVMTVGEDKKLKARISIDDNYVRPCGIEVDSCYNIAVGKDTVYLATEEHSGKAEYGRTNEIMAFDFDSGNTKWKAEAGEKRSFVPIRMDGPNLLAYKLPDYDAGGEVVSIEPGKGKQTLLLKMPRVEQGEGEQAFNISSSSLREPVRFQNGKLFLSSSTVSEPDSDYDDPFDKLAAGFGPQ
ncbi:PQQ-binding-like beta-propeller repeat protein [Streptomyces qinglanensis]|uniref:PQQ-binding-like beta-propeller repeat protein n=1 Tax=Streptomyces qinglanensis TaxID=943816 RepID=UPI003D70ACBF